MIIWYKNSFLASLVSIIGCGMALFGIMSLISGETDSVLLSVLCIAAGLPLIFLGRRISDKKALKKAQQQQKQPAEKAPQAAPAAPAAQPAAAAAAVSAPAAVSRGASPRTPGVFAGILFLLAIVLIGVRLMILFMLYGGALPLPTVDILQAACWLLMAIASFRAGGGKPGLCIAGFWAVFALNVYCFVRFLMAVGASYPISLIYSLQENTILLIIAGLISAILSHSAKARGRFARGAWFLPGTLLLVGLFLLDFRTVIAAFKYLMIGRPEMMQNGIIVLQDVAVGIAFLMAGLSLRRCAAKEIPAPVQPAAAPDGELKKTLKAYQDLYDCGILSKEDYEQKIRELTRG